MRNKDQKYEIIMFSKPQNPFNCKKKKNPNRNFCKHFASRKAYHEINSISTTCQC